MWQIRYSPRATAGIYTIPRGIAGNVSEAIKTLPQNPWVGEQVEGRPDTYEIRPEGHLVRYELIETSEPQVIVILTIE
jgi:hypothetical protein